MTFHRVEDLHRALDSGQTTCVQLVQESLRKARAENPSINAVAEFFEGSAMEQAVAVDARRAQGDCRALDGVTMVIKDNMVYRDHAFSGGGEMTRALGASGTLNTQLVFPDQNFDVMGWDYVRGDWGSPHPGGATIVMADGSVVSVPHGTDITSFVGIDDQIINDSSKLGR
jgi:prepilin-type processing-associated H-X9-DG protein